MEAQQTIAASISGIFRAAFLARKKQARLVRRAAKKLGLATRGEVADLASRADLALGRARRGRREAQEERGGEGAPS